VHTLRHCIDALRAEDAVMSAFDFIKRLLRRPPAVGAAGAETGGTALRDLSSPEFEALIGEAFRVQGYQVTPTGGGQADGGASLVLRRDRQTHFVHCKQWRESRVGVEVVQGLHAAMTARGATGGFIVSSGRFSREAMAFAAGCGIRLVDGPALAGMIAKLRPGA
jgi:restriction system protein